jgi:UDP-glucuronate 4-epimerase
MAMYKFTEAIENGKPLTLFNRGNMARDFTYVDDVVEGLVLVLEWRSPLGKPQVFNLGNSEPVELKNFVRSLEKALNKTALVVDGGVSKGEVLETFADTTLARALLGFSPSVGIDEGAARFVEWYRGPFRQPGFEHVAMRH